ncbi:MAG: cell wall-binding repeat-containing protein [Actinobacteria bacterium]|nr:cell wall-binding repeat-containing protein [Actinomycetota bacterium]MBU1609370.1 cell wall-binding repeat-containing protein [Actinomycetota bacterium]MBU2315002.1 cell wall-binding repeat-containing protein [Actinomycetota bacterium]MBU2385032.1 cell wall-binding repeat-containing protein [Actinomycetota bacterium]
MSRSITALEASAPQARRRSLRAVAAIGAAALLGSLVVVSTPAYAQPIEEPVVVDETPVDRAVVSSGTFESAASRSDFDPGYIISDVQFYDRDAMTQSQIQSFLDRMIGSCQNSNCLNVYSQSTTSRAATERCRSYSGASSESAARIIYKVQQACGISAKVILVTLQKEQSLVTRTAPSSSTLERAMGYYCPDDPSRPGWCHPDFAGFYNQVYNASAQFQRYRLNPSGYNYRIGSNSILHHPNTACGRKSVTIRNAATAGLYIYTPYTPNSAAMSNLYGLGDSCSSYGNRNFWRLYTDWFGNPTGQLSSTVSKSRVAGADRYSTSVALAASAYPDPSTVSTVYIAVGSGFADGLAAAPAAAVAGGPLLLTNRSSLPSSVRSEIQRLEPENIVVVGGPSVVSGSVIDALKTLAPTVTRVSGDDRYATARALALLAFPDGASEVFVASGGNFPDALAASAAAGSRGVPVLLVPPGSNAADSATRSVIDQLGATRVVAAGGTAVISSSYLTSLKSGTSVTSLVRRGGADRYKTAASINDYAFPAATAGYLASGVNFPDALAAAAVAGAQHAPLHLSPGSCLPAAAVGHLTLSGVESLTFVGGTSVLTSNAYNYRPCS